MTIHLVCINCGFTVKDATDLGLENPSKKCPNCEKETGYLAKVA